MTRGDLRDEILVRSGKDTTSAWVTDAILNDWLSQSHRWAANFKKWPFPEGRVSTTWASSTEEWDFEGYQSNSFRYLEVGGKRFQKVNWEDYKIYKEQKSTGQDKIYSEFGGLVFVNTSADVSGTLTAYGKYMPANFDATDDTTETVFSEGNDEGNQAIIEEGIAYAMRRDGKLDEALQHHNLAIDHLNRLWEKIKAEKSLEHTVEVRGGMFKRMDVLKGGFEDVVNNESRFF